MDVVTTALENLLSPLILFFGLGFVASLLKSDLSVPESMAKGIAIYLMFAIGMKGGAEVAHSGGNAGLFGAMLSGVGLGLVLPVIAFGILRAITRLDRKDAAAIAAHYGSISVVTFVAATEYLTTNSIPFAGYMVAVVALMESPAIVSGLLLAGSGDRSSSLYR
ncbi:MAG: sodium-dependent bicarbonate transport family permease, partial [Myxococcota bacterium]